MDFPGILRGTIAVSSENTAVSTCSAAALKRKRPRADGDAQKTVDHERPFLSSTGRGAFFLFGKSKRKNGAHFPAKRPGAAWFPGADPQSAVIGAARSWLSPRRGKSAIQRSENTRISVSPMCFPGTARWRRCREATERGRLAGAFPLSGAAAPALPTLPRGASQGAGGRNAMTNPPPRAGSFDSPCGLAQDDSAVERSDLGIAPYARDDSLRQPSRGRSTAATSLSEGGNGGRLIAAPTAGTRN